MSLGQQLIAVTCSVKGRFSSWLIGRLRPAARSGLALRQAQGERGVVAAYAASIFLEARFRSCGSRCRFLNRTTFGVTSTSSSSWM
jgi:hypothetical protein